MYYFIHGWSVDPIAAVLVNLLVDITFIVIRIIFVFLLLSWIVIPLA